MKLNLRKYVKLLDEDEIHMIYNGPIWANGIDGIAELLLKRFEIDGMPFGASQSVFSVFVEQINNIMMYSADKEVKSDEEGNLQEISRGILALGIRDSKYFIQCGNLVTNNSADILKSRLDYLNALDKRELRRYFNERAKADNPNKDSRGAGLGLIVVARRASLPIEYNFEAQGESHKFFTMYITID